MVAGKKYLVFTNNLHFSCYFLSFKASMDPLPFNFISMLLKISNNKTNIHFDLRCRVFLKVKQQQEIFLRLSTCLPFAALLLLALRTGSCTTALFFYPSPWDYRRISHASTNHGFGKREDICRKTKSVFLTPPIELEKRPVPISQRKCLKT